MSNVIKSRYVYLNGEDKKIIDTNEKVEKIILNHWNKPKKTVDEYAVTREPDADGFTEGLNAKVIEVSSEEEEITIQLQSDEIIAEANRQAFEIIKQAEQDARITSQRIFNEAKNKGYEEGLLKGQGEIDRKKQELSQLIQQQQNDYSMQVHELEPAFAKLVAVYVEKITGIVVQDKQEVIHYLIHNAMIHSEVSKSFVIRVSKDDYDYVLSRKDDLQKLVSSEVTIDITLDKELIKNQCLIEIDTRIIDCSLDVQLANLVQDIKLLSTTID